MAQIFIPGGCGCCATPPCQLDPCPNGFPIFSSMSPADFTGPGFASTPISGTGLWEYLNDNIIYFCAQTTTANGSFSSLNICNQLGSFPWRTITPLPFGPPGFAQTFADNYGAFSAAVQPYGYQFTWGTPLDVASYTAILIRKGTCRNLYTSFVTPYGFGPFDPGQTWLILDAGARGSGAANGSVVYTSSSVTCNGSLTLNFHSQTGIDLVSWPTAITLGGIYDVCPPGTCSPDIPINRNLFFAPYPEPTQPNTPYPGPVFGGGLWTGIGTQSNSFGMFGDFVLYPRFTDFSECVWFGYRWGLSPLGPTDRSSFFLGPWAATCKLQYLGSGVWQASIYGSTSEQLDINGTGGRLQAVYQGTPSANINDPTVVKQIPVQTCNFGTVPAIFYWW